MTTNLTRIERDGATAIITITRTEALNALSLAVEAEIKAAIEAARDDAEIRAIILTGEGRAFSVGVDLKELGDGAGMKGRTWHGPESLSGVMRACETPLIAAVNGFAVTGGLELALQCDFIIASDTARFADTHARVGITPSWGLTQILPRLIGENRAKQMSLTGQYIDAATATAWGLVNEIAPAEELLNRARAIAAEIAETDPVAMGKIKALIEEGMTLALPDALTREVAIFDKHMAGVTPAAIAETRKKVQARGKRVVGSS